MNTMDWVNLIEKFLLLNLLGVCSELALKKRYWNLWFLMLALFITYFRTTLLRAVSMYVGVFSKMPVNKVVAICDFLQGSLATTITDSIILIAVILTYLTLQSIQKTGTKN